MAFVLAAYSTVALRNVGYPWVEATIAAISLTSLVSAIGGYLFLVGFFLRKRMVVMPR